MDIAVDISGTVIETDRLLLRAWRAADLTDLYEYASVEGVGEMAGWRHHRSIEETRRILLAFMAGKNVFAVVHKQDNKVIGSLGLHKSWANDDERYAHLKVKEIGFVLSKAYWGQGLMPEAVKALIRYSFDKLGLEALTVAHFTFNDRSRRVIEKCGFVFVKQGPHYSEQLNKTFVSKKYILFPKQAGAAHCP
ncbi:MAG: GNAT family N-acetyltransferase [Limnochordia bacterium]|jgi:ribosomal-protein-alanine N-acetyltransferase|nr:GNAT family N-acetyltransferase [Bacillota bacterium]HOB09528.1 GNAT family N-acetyltransferase [Limnochordia bacterium]NLH31250.1 GNAT family N-acetyltransferase [Bacillota bacterium]HPZ30828.1 GNAT family N-acetyltransferase [Limnochordia bacterium]HQD71235.1 GNAT family N-acetyltransferase [Limnochordia bacterium]